MLRRMAGTRHHSSRMPTYLARAASASDSLLFEFPFSWWQGHSSEARERESRRTASPADRGTLECWGQCT